MSPYCPASAGLFFIYFTRTKLVTSLIPLYNLSIEAVRDTAAGYRTPKTEARFGSLHDTQIGRVIDFNRHGITLVISRACDNCFEG